MKKYFIALVAAAFLFAISPVRAQYQDQAQAEDQANDQTVQPGQPGPAANQQTPTSADANAPGMGRVSYVHGSVSTQRGDNAEWVPAIVNTPVAVGDRVSTGPDGRAEVQLDYADILRMSSSATAKVAQLNRNTIQVQVGQGLVTYTVMKDGQAAPEIDTPNAALHPSGPGEYRILVNSDAETEITVRSGSAQVSTPQGSTDVNSGQMITVAGTDNPQYKISTAPASDEWDSWNNDRNQKIEDAQSWHDTDPYYTGSGDLDGYGTWSEVPDYGQVWIPSEPAGWAPYRNGNWVYEPYYGWTWVSYDPWGWAPYHYGRWFMWDNSWAWWPGPVAYNPFYYPVWAPAYVSFFGWGGGGWGFGVGFGFGFGGFGTIGWLPCGPGDWYHPWYGRWGNGYRFYDGRGGFGGRGFHDGFAPLGHGRDGFSNFNEAARNDRVRAGFSSMSGRDFGHGPVSMHQGRISASQFSQARMVGGRMPVTPTRASYSPTGRAADPRSFRSAPPASQHFFTGGNRNTGFNRGASSFARGQSPASNGSRGSFHAMNSNSGGSRGTITSSRSGWRNFTPPSGDSRSGFQGNRGASNSGRESFGNRSEGTSFRGNANRGGNWQHFTPQARQSFRPGGADYGGSQQRGYQGRGYQGQTGAYRGGYSGGRSSRPPLNMHQPIVQPRGGNYGGYGRSPYGGGSRGYSAPRGGYSAPRGGGGGYRGGAGGGYRGGGGGGGYHGGGGGGHAGGGGHGGGGHGR